MFSVMQRGLDNLNDQSKPFCLDRRNDTRGAKAYHRCMAEPIHDWYFRAWLEHFDKNQADVVEHVGWNKSKASLFWKGAQRYHRDDINELADYLNLEPFELLMPPERAMSYRQLRASATQIAGMGGPVREVINHTFTEKISKRRDGRGPAKKTGTSE